MWAECGEDPAVPGGPRVGRPRSASGAGVQGRQREGARLCPAAARAPGDVPLVTRQQASGTAAAPNPERGACASGDLLPVAPEGSLEERTAARRPGGERGAERRGGSRPGSGRQTQGQDWNSRPGSS